MILGFLFLLLSIAGSGLIYYFTNLWTVWYWFWIPLVSIPILFLLIFGLHIIFMGFLSLFVDKKKEQVVPNKFFYWFITETIWIIMLFSNTKVHTTGLDKLPKGTKYLFVSNHISKFDQFCTLLKLPKEGLIFISKPENLDIPIAGAFMHKAGFIPINRTDNVEGLKAILKAVNAISKGYASVGISPEGTRSKTLELLPFHPGSFKIATKTHCPIVVACFQNTHLVKRNFFFKRTNVYFDILKTIPYEEYKDKNTIEISSEVENMIKEHQTKTSGRFIR